jgi:hypothetical protein
LLGLLGVYFAIYRPIRLAQSGSASITTSRGLILISPLLVISGATYILFPKFVERHLGVQDNKPSNPKTVIGWLFAITGLAIGIGLMVWVQSFLHRLGY